MMTYVVKNSLAWLGGIAIIAGILMVLVVPIAIGGRGELYRSLRGHYREAVLAATPLEFAQGMRALDQTLQEAGMVQGNTNIPFLSVTSPQDDMRFKRERIQAFATRAEQLAALPPTSVEVSTDLARLQATVLRLVVSAYGFWLWNQGGALYQVLMPLILAGSGVAVLILRGRLPDYIPRRSGARTSSA